MSHSSIASASSALEPYVPKWSSSTFVTTATRGRSAKAERSDSSPSTTSHPGPVPALPPSWGTTPPMIHAGSSPVSRSAWAIIAAVVVLPCAPVTTIEGRAATSSARNAARGVPPMRSRWAVETITSNPSGGRGSPPRSTSMPSSVSLKIVSCASHPRTSAPRARATFAYADMPEPAIPTKYSRRPPSGSGVTRVPRERHELVRDDLRRVRSRESKHGVAHHGQTRGVGEQLGDERRDAIHLRVGHELRSPAPLEVTCVERLVIGGRVRVGDEDRGRAGRRELPHGPAGA